MHSPPPPDPLPHVLFRLPTPEPDTCRERGEHVNRLLVPVPCVRLRSQLGEDIRTLGSWPLPLPRCGVERVHGIRALIPAAITIKGASVRI